MKILSKGPFNLHLSYEDRCQIYALMKSGMSYNLIAKHISVHRSTISRKLIRNKGKRGYRHEQAHKLDSIHPLLHFIVEKAKLFEKLLLSAYFWLRFK